ncbi:hypothetical protein AK88_00111 [Plasmodium fragile]|uniref:Uncharacterized protein n=1 Tax=Plasmodium fragile TaxID=5857 RepID=A0A0D9QTH8_PLAFR|nr:uncharacterized protein AK88_00111 [Plasmodium fragile]KJP90263.1 hypothetical protein AK88_00111 [Plasmodium fragile]
MEDDCTKQFSRNRTQPQHSENPHEEFTMYKIKNTLRTLDQPIEQYGVGNYFLNYYKWGHKKENSHSSTKEDSDNGSRQHNQGDEKRNVEFLQLQKRNLLDWNPMEKKKKQSYNLCTHIDIFGTSNGSRPQKSLNNYRISIDLTHLEN